MDFPSCQSQLKFPAKVSCSLRRCLGSVPDFAHTKSAHPTSEDTGDGDEALQTYFKDVQSGTGMMIIYDYDGSFFVLQNHPTYCILHVRLPSGTKPQGAEKLPNKALTTARSRMNLSMQSLANGC